MITLEKLARLSARHMIKCAEEPRPPEIGGYTRAPAMTPEIAARLGDPRTNDLQRQQSTSAWKKGPWKPESGKPNPYLVGMLDQPTLGPAVNKVDLGLHSLDVRGQLTDAIARQQTEGGTGAGFTPRWQAQSPHPERMLQERGMTGGANIHGDYEGSPAEWMARFAGPHAMPGTGETWVPEDLPFQGITPLRIGGSKPARNWADIMGRHTVLNHELEHATRQHDIVKQLSEVGIEPGVEYDETNFTPEQLDAYQMYLQSRGFAEIGPSLGDLVFRGEQFDRENPGEILYNKPIPPSEKNWVTGKPNPPEVEDPRPWYQRFNPLTGTEPPEQPPIPQGPPVPEHDAASIALRATLDDPTSSPEQKAAVRRALAFMDQSRDSAANREDELVIELPGGVKMRQSALQNMAAEHGYWGGGHPQYKINNPLQQDASVRPLSMHELMFKNIEKDPIKQQFFERMVRGESQKARREDKEDTWHSVGGGEMEQWKDMSPEEQAKWTANYPDRNLEDDDRFEQFDIHKQQWQDSEAARAAEEKILREAEWQRDLDEHLRKKKE